MHCIWWDYSDGVSHGLGSLSLSLIMSILFHFGCLVWLSEYIIHYFSIPQNQMYEHLHFRQLSLYVYIYMCVSLTPATFLPTESSLMTIYLCWFAYTLCGWQCHAKCVDHTNRFKIIANIFNSGIYMAFASNTHLFMLLQWMFIPFAFTAFLSFPIYTFFASRFFCLLSMSCYSFFLLVSSGNFRWIATKEIRFTKIDNY